MADDFIQELELEFLLRALCTVPRKPTRTERLMREFIRKQRAQQTYLVFTMPSIPHVHETVRRMNIHLMGVPRRDDCARFLYHPLAYKRPVMVFDWQQNDAFSLERWMAEELKRRSAMFEGTHRLCPMCSTPMEHLPASNGWYCDNHP